VKTTRDDWLYNEGTHRVAKKKKNPKHTEAVRRKADATAEMAKLGLKLGDDIALIGFIFSHLALSHRTYLGLLSINQFCRNYTGVDICIFSQHLIQPCVPLLCPVFKVSDLIRWGNYPLVTTDIGTTIEALSSNASVIYHFCFDPEFINQPHMESSELKSAFCDPRIRIITRHEDHKELIEAEFGISVCGIIPDFDVEEIVQLAMYWKHADVGEKNG
jgi:hypothetical protein